VRYAKFFTLWDPESLVLSNHFLFKLILDKLLSAAQKKTWDGMIFSVHDMNLASILMALYLDKDYEFMEVGSSIWFDLHSGDSPDDPEFYVQIMINDYPKSLSFCQGWAKCHLK